MQFEERVRLSEGFGASLRISATETKTSNPYNGIFERKA